MENMFEGCKDTLIIPDKFKKKMKELGQ